jgi:hypothetical protein
VEKDRGSRRRQGPSFVPVHTFRGALGDDGVGSVPSCGSGGYGIPKQHFNGLCCTATLERKVPTILGARSEGHLLSMLGGLHTFSSALVAPESQMRADIKRFIFKLRLLTVGVAALVG